MRMLKWIALITGVLAGLAAFVFVLERKKEEKEALDHYMMADGTKPEAVEIMNDQEKLIKDILTWGEEKVPSKSVTLTFGFKTDSDAASFQEEMAKAGYSSDLDSKNFVVDVIYNHDFDIDSLNELAQASAISMDECRGSYQGFHFDR